MGDNKLSRGKKNILYLCELGFLRETPRKDGYSMKEFDVYDHIPRKAERKFHVSPHRLTIWKNIRKNIFELAKIYHEAKIEVILRGSFEDVCKKAAELEQKYWGVDQVILPCPHQGNPECDIKFLQEYDKLQEELKVLKRELLEEKRDQKDPKDVI